MNQKQENSSISFAQEINNMDNQKKTLENPEKIRMVVCDLDGTLLYKPGQLSEKARKTIHELRSQGILFGICSGRPIGGLKNMLPVWKIEDDVDFVLGFNGGAIYHPKDQTEEDWLKIPADLIGRILDRFKGYSFSFAEYEGNEMLADRKNVMISQMARRNRLNLKIVSEKQLERDTLKLMAVGMPWTVSRFLKENRNEPDAGYRFFRSGPFLIEIVSSRLSKLEGVLRVAEEYGLKPDQILCFGNDNNDLEMIEGTVGVAVKNALPEVIEKASAVAGSNRSDGVALFLQENLLESSRTPEAGKQNQK